MRSRRQLAACCCALLCAVTWLPAVAASPGAAEVRFAPGASATEVKGQLKGRDDADHRLVGSAGQTMRVELVTHNPSINFNVWAPGARDAMFIGGADNTATLLLPDDGAYRLQVFLVRSAARRGERGSYTLKVSITGQALPPLPARLDAQLPGSRFHAQATVRCRPPYAAGLSDCEAGVVRRGRDGTATVQFTGPNKLPRSVLFVGGKAVASDSSEPIKASRQGDLTTVTIGESETYPVPDALLTGG